VARRLGWSAIQSAAQEPQPKGITSPSDCWGLTFRRRAPEYRRGILVSLQPFHDFSHWVVGFVYGVGLSCHRGVEHSDLHNFWSTMQQSHQFQEWLLKKIMDKPMKTMENSIKTIEKNPETSGAIDEQCEWEILATKCSKWEILAAKTKEGSLDDPPKQKCQKKANLYNFAIFRPPGNFTIFHALGLLRPSRSPQAKFVSLTLEWRALNSSWHRWKKLSPTKTPFVCIEHKPAKWLWQIPNPSGFWRILLVHPAATTFFLLSSNSPCCDSTPKHWFSQP